MQKINFKSLVPDLVALGSLLLVSLLYSLPVLQGKTVNLHDNMQATAGGRSVTQYHEQTGEWSAWCDSMFGGMPAFMIAGDYPYSYFSKIGAFIVGLLPNPTIFIFLMMLGAYIFLRIIKQNQWLSVLGGIAFALGTYSLVSIEAGHLSKMLAIAYMPMVLGGAIVCLRGQYIKGAALLGFFMTLELYSNHVQITFYMGLMLMLLMIFEGIRAIKEKQLKGFINASVVIALTMLLGIGTNAERLWNNYEFSKETIRGKSELSESIKKSGGDGLEKDYAFEYSYGIAESLTLLIPNAFGGASMGGLSTKSEIYKTMATSIDPANAQQFVEAQLGAYWGEISFTAGPAYAGAIICFLFILGMFIVRNSLKWWLVASTALLLMFSWGGNFDVLNGFLFRYFPLFNKFRAVTMTLSLVQFFMVAMAVLTIKTILDQRPSFQEIKKPLLISLGIIALLCVVPGLMFDFTSSNDTQLRDSLAQATQNKEFGVNAVNALRADRQSMYWSDAFRALALVLVTVGLIWAFLQRKMKENILLPTLIVLVTLDLFSVGKRFFNAKDFISKSTLQQTFEPSPTDNIILADKDPNYRVFDLTGNLIANALPSYFHKSLGGYQAARLRRYQDLFERQLAKGNRGVINMLNVKYFVQPDQAGTPQVAPNPEALGNAWFVKNYTIVPNPDAEMTALDKLDPKQTAIIDKRFEEQVKGLSIKSDSAQNTIKLTDYKPNKLNYSSNTQSEQLAVFSEMYYRGDRDWNAYIDGKLVPHLRANYVLRAMRVPAGKHEIMFEFKPITVEKGKIIDLISNILMACLIGFAAFKGLKA